MQASANPGGGLFLCPKENAMQNVTYAWKGYGFAGAPTCCTSVRDGQDHLVTCTELGIEGIWSPTEPESLAAWDAEHHGAHVAQMDRQLRQQEYAAAWQRAQHIYRTTEPGEPRRRGIGAYL
jgi:hypothetical protein